MPCRSWRVPSSRRSACRPDTSLEARSPFWNSFQTSHRTQLCPVNEREREMFYLTTHSTHFIYGYMASDIWLRTILIVRKETRCRHIGYSYRLIARVLLYAPSHRQDNTYHGLCYTSRGALAGTMPCEWMNECLTTPQHKKQIGYWVSEKGKCMKWLYH